MTALLRPDGGLTRGEDGWTPGEPVRACDHDLDHRDLYRLLTFAFFYDFPSATHDAGNTCRLRIYAKTPFRFRTKTRFGVSRAGQKPFLQKFIFAPQYGWKELGTVPQLPLKNGSHSAPQLVTAWLELSQQCCKLDNDLGVSSPFE
ncbi:hypothetical protein [Methylobacterium sp. Leaf106]|uniref:hypothetical protein n=1 Tax=Methylobacterium sp. Leaf106 TaxID=1736255 RepID=UPI0012E82BAA|nr:hypothetical protein [Methylobacterium sp. Leaf106]